MEDVMDLSESWEKSSKDELWYRVTDYVAVISSIIVNI